MKCVAGKVFRREAPRRRLGRAGSADGARRRRPRTRFHFTGYFASNSAGVLGASGATVVGLGEKFDSSIPELHPEAASKPSHTIETLIRREAEDMTRLLRYRWARTQRP